MTRETALSGDGANGPSHDRIVEVLTKLMRLYPKYRPESVGEKQEAGEMVEELI